MDEHRTLFDKPGVKAERPSSAASSSHIAVFRPSRWISSLAESSVDKCSSASQAVASRRTLTAVERWLSAVSSHPQQVALFLAVEALDVEVEPTEAV